MSRCTGHCCRAFVIPYSPEELRARLDNKELPPVQDGEQIAAMLIYIGEFTGAEAFKQFSFGDPDVKDDMVKRSHYYTCKNYDVAAHLCKTYETRPSMCADYPYGKACRYNACTAPDKGINLVDERKPPRVHLPILNQPTEVEKILEELTP